MAAPRRIPSSSDTPEGLASWSSSAFFSASASARLRISSAALAASSKATFFIKSVALGSSSSRFMSFSCRFSVPCRNLRDLILLKVAGRPYLAPTTARRQRSAHVRRSPRQSSRRRHLVRDDGDDRLGGYRRRNRRRGARLAHH